MNKFAVSACVLAVALGAYNLRAIKLVINETLNMGTLTGVENCVSYSKNDLVSIETTRNACATRLQTFSYEPDLAMGRAGPRYMNDGVYLEGELHNKTSNQVTTWVGLVLGMHDADGKRVEFTAGTQIWIEPSSSSEFIVELKDAPADVLETLDFCDHEAKKPKSCVFWAVAKMGRITI